MVDDSNYDPQRTVNNVKGIIAIISLWYLFNAYATFMEYIRETTFSGLGLDRFVITYCLEIIIPLVIILMIGRSFQSPEDRIYLSKGK